MLEYSKLILTKVSFDEALFKKELAKSFGYLEEKEKMAFAKWCLQTFNLTKDYLRKIIV